MSIVVAFVVSTLTAVALGVVDQQTAHAAFPGRDGLIAFASSRDGAFQIFTMNAAGGQVEKLTTGTGADREPAWSADGAKLAFTSTRDGNPEIYVMDADGANQTRLTSTGDQKESAPAWSPDGTRIVYQRAPVTGQNPDIWVMNADGTNQLQLTNDVAEDVGPTWSPDGTKIMFATLRNAEPGGGPGWDIFLMNPDGSDQTGLITGPIRDDSPEWSPDGSKILFSSSRGSGAAYTANADGTNVQPFPGIGTGDTIGSWSPSGKYAAFTDSHQEIYRTTGPNWSVLRLSQYPTLTHVAIDTEPAWQPVLGPPDPTGEFTPLTPARIVDTRTGAGGKLGKLGSGQQFEVQITGQGGVPATGVGAVVLNATATEPTAASYLTLWPQGFTRPLPSNLNYVPGQTVPNLVTVGVNNGKVSVYNNAGATHVILDVVGFYSTSVGPVGSRFHPLEPLRYFDTREGLGGVAKAPMNAGQTLHFKVAGANGVPFDGVTSVVMNVTVTEPTSSGHVIVYPDDVARPTASNLNFVPGLTVPNLVVVRVPANGIVDFYNFSNLGGTIHLLADVVGYFDGDQTTEAGRLVSGLPQRLVDTRISSPAPPPGCIPDHSSLILTFPNPAIGAVVLNVTVTQPTASGYVTVHPYPASPPLASTLNYVPGQTVPNLAMVGVGPTGDVAFYNLAGCTHLVIDAFGAFTSSNAPPPSVAAAEAPDGAQPYGEVTVGVG